MKKKGSLKKNHSVKKYHAMEKYYSIAFYPEDALHLVETGQAQVYDSSPNEKVFLMLHKEPSKELMTPRWAIYHFVHIMNDIDPCEY